MKPWRVRVAAPARADLRAVIAWTRREFGPVQARRYRMAVEAALASLGERGPMLAGSRPAHPSRPELRRFRLSGRGRHALIYREAPARTVIVLRVLHDAMDLARHMPPPDAP